MTSTNESPHPELGSLQNFWRSAENFQTGGHLTYSLEGDGGMLWAVSQAAPLRRVIVDQNLFLWYLRIPPEGVSSTDARYPKQGVALDYAGWQELGYKDPIGDFASTSSDASSLLMAICMLLTVCRYAKGYRLQGMQLRSHLNSRVLDAICHALRVKVAATWRMSKHLGRA